MHDSHVSWKTFSDETCETESYDTNCELETCCAYGDGKYYKITHTDVEGEMKVKKYTDDGCRNYYWDTYKTYTYMETDESCVAAPDQEGKWY